MSILAYTYGPFLIYKFYLGKTGKDLIRINRIIYWDLAESENKILAEKIIIRRWLHVRGLQIDEGHIAPTLNERWIELIKYWSTQSKGAE